MKPISGQEKKSKEWQKSNLFSLETFSPKLCEHAFPFFVTSLFSLTLLLVQQKSGKKNRHERVFIPRLPFYLIGKHTMKQEIMNQTICGGEMQKDHFFGQEKQTEGRGRRSSGKGWNCRVRTAKRKNEKKRSDFDSSPHTSFSFIHSFEHEFQKSKLFE